MIDWRSAVTWVPGLGSSVRDVRRGLRCTWRLRAARLAALAARPGTAETPWTVLDVTAAVFWMIGLMAAGVAALVAFRLAASFAFAFGETTGRVRGGTYDALSAAVQPYATLAALLLLGMIACGAVFYGIYRTTIRRYRVPWSALGFRRIGWKRCGLIAALFVPLTLIGALVLRLETALLRAPLHNPQDALLTRGVAALPLNVLLLFILLVVVVPVAEETFFRGFLYRLLRRDLPAWAAASGSALPAALLHGAPLLPWFLFMGIAYALVVERTRSLYSSIILHSLANAVAALGIVAVICNW